MPTMGWTMFSIEDTVMEPTKSLHSMSGYSGRWGRGCSGPFREESANNGYSASLEPLDSWANCNLSGSSSVNKDVDQMTHDFWLSNSRLCSVLFECLSSYY